MQRVLIITALGVGAIVTGLVSEVYALPRTQSQTEAGVTLSGDSLRNLETRDAEDFSTFFSGVSPNSQSGNNLSIAPTSQPSLLGNIEVSGSTSSPNSGNATDPLLFPNGDSDQQVRVRYRVTE
jgi:hypothetical protein